MSNFVSLNGQIQEIDTAKLSVKDRGFTLGDGVFETIAIVNKKPLYLAAHLTRLQSGCDFFYLKAETDLVHQSEAIITANNLTTGSLRITVSRGPASERGLDISQCSKPTILITTASYTPAQQIIDVVVSDVTRRNEYSPLSQIKSLNYGDQILARIDAANRRASDALLLNTQNNLACASAGNVFIVLARKVLTPYCSDGALPGIARHLLLEGGFAHEKTISQTELAEADAIFITNSLNIQSISKINGKSLNPVSTLIKDLRVQFWPWTIV